MLGVTVAPNGMAATYTAQFVGRELFEFASQSLWVYISFASALPSGTKITVSNWCVTKAGEIRNPPEPLPRYSEVFEILHPPRPDEREMTEQINCPFHEGSLTPWTSLNIAEGQLSIILPENEKVVIGAGDFPPTRRFELIQVPDTSELIFKDENITLTVRSLLVYGKLRIGGPGCRVQGPIRIIFWGDRSDPDTNLAGFGSKGMAALGVSAHVDMFGRRFYPTWTRLARIVRSGDDRAYLQAAVNWHVGQEVVLTTTTWDDRDTNLPHQNEVLTIKAIGSGGTVVQFDRPVTYTHYAGTEYQGEIALLSRTVEMEGEPSTDGFGGHSVVSGVQGRFAGVSTRYMGQTNVLAKYPFHLHLIGKDSGSMITDSVTRDTYFRCYTIHGTSGSLINENVAFNVTGNCVYIEDGVEEENVFSYNLISHVKPIGSVASQNGDDFVLDTTASGLDSNDRVFPADASSAAFYISNSYNEFIGNVASGGWVGYSFPSLPFSVGIYQNERLVQPRSRPIKRFTGNTCHSSTTVGDITGCIYVGGVLHYGSDNNLHYTFGRESRSTVVEPGFSTTTTPTYMQFNNTLVYAGSKGILHWGDRVEFTRFEMHDVTGSFSTVGEAWLDNGIISGFSGNVDAGFRSYSRRGHDLYDDPAVRIIMSNVEFRNYQSTACASQSFPDVPAVTYPDSSCSPTGDTSLHANTVWLSTYTSSSYAPTYRMATSKITFSNVDYDNLISFKIANTASSRMFNFVDADGSALLEGRPTIVGSNLDWWKICTDCRFEPRWSVWMCPKKPPSDGTTNFEEREVIHVSVATPSIAAGKGGIGGTCQGINGDYSNCDVGKVTLWGSDPSRSMKVSSNPGITGLSSTGWHLQLDRGAAKYLTLQPSQVPAGASFRFSTPYPAGTTFDITGSHPNVADVKFTAVGSLVDLFASEDTTKYFFDNEILYLVPALPSGIRAGGFERAGVTIDPVQSTYVIHIQASCSVDADGFCDVAVSDRLPGWDVVCPTKPVSPGPVLIPSSTPNPPATPIPTVGIIDNYDTGPAGSAFVAVWLLVFTNTLLLLL
eukprot:TRINITY_DN21808_c0_g1_i1.p1 TRINITY_DN21808_c0_g1~~TRINITY_DN21808_c0_g1_i1.p1  ORF type:complete len:1214 (+),score=160.81 TRINITY_DN21808_c0_g1_i1:480-3644(+)